MSQSVIDPKFASPKERTKPNSILDIDMADVRPECQIDVPDCVPTWNYGTFRIVVRYSMMYLEGKYDSQV